MNSALYTGWVRHRRYLPKAHAFRYRVFMLLLDLDELEQLRVDNPLLSSRRFAPLSFRREDHYGDAGRPLKSSILDLVESETGSRPDGRVMLLTNPRLWGYCFNPISVYYCYASKGERVAATVAEVTNTPWRERHCYVLPADSPDGRLKTEFGKRLHVSPFMPPELTYRWHGRKPGKTLSVHLESHQFGERLLDATVAMRRKPLSTQSLATTLMIHPFMTTKVTFAIHWQAVRLWSKGLRIFDHPNKRDCPFGRLGH